MTTEDTERAAAIAWFREDPKRLDFARPAGAPRHLVQGDRVETADGSRATVTGPAPRGPHGEPAVNLDWDGDAGGPAYEHDLRRVVDARPAAGRDLTAVEDGPTAVELLDDNERLGVALVDIGIAVGLPRPSATVRWGAPEILARLATLNSELGVPPRATARIAQARADQAEGYGSTTSTVDGLLRELDRRGGELVRLRAACARPAVARTDGPTDVAGAERPANGSAPGVGTSAPTDGQPPAWNRVVEPGQTYANQPAAENILRNEADDPDRPELGWAIELALTALHPTSAAPAEDEPCVCRTDFTCMATEHTSLADDTAAPDMPAIVAGVERSYVEALTAILAASGGSEDVDRWRGQAEAYRTVAEQLRRDHGMPRVEYGSGEWRRAQSVQTAPRAGQPVRDTAAPDGKSGPRPLANDDMVPRRRYDAAMTVLRDREAELMELQGPCPTEDCRSHRGHRGPHDIAHLSGGGHRG